MSDSNSIKVLVIDNDDTFVAAVEDVLTEEGYNVLTALRGEQGMQKLAEDKDIRVLLLDLRMPGLLGEEVLRRLKGDPKHKDIPVVIVTADRDMGKALEMLEKGAAKFVVKPLTADELVAVVKDVVTPPENYKEVGWTVQADLEEIGRIVTPYNPEEGDALQGKSDIMLSLIGEVYRVAQLDSNVMILGETGVGKELVARTLHKHSKRQNGPFIVINCGSLPSYDLIYSELWGHERGTLTGAVSKRLGRVRQAEGGIVFLDYIDRLEARMQSQLLQFCDTKQASSLGSDEVFTVDARIIAAANRHIEEAVRDGQFLEDLYYRLSGSIISVPPLRERRQRTKESTELRGGEAAPIVDDIEILTDYAIDRYNKEENRALPVEGIEIEALEVLKGYEWPGNVRQLNHVINEAASRASMRTPNRVITKKDIESSRFFGGVAVLASLSDATLTDLYKAMLVGDHTDARRFADKVNEIVNKAGGNISRASDLANVSRVTMYKYIREAREINLRS